MVSTLLQVKNMEQAKPKKRSRRRGVRRRIATSLEVFMSFVRKDVDGNINVSEMFTVKCFQKWVDTRVGGLKHPEQAFHRTFLAHIRGKDTRKPFPPDIETEIVKLLRSNRTLWSQCFPSNKFNIGRQKFRHKGYYEEHPEAVVEYKKEQERLKMMEKADAPYNFEDLDDLLYSSVLPSVQIDDFHVAPIPTIPTEVNTFSLEKKRPMYEYDMSYPVKRVRRSVYETQAFYKLKELRREFSEGNLAGDCDVSTVSASSASADEFSTPWQRLVSVANTFTNQKEIEDICMEAEKFNVTLFPPAIKFFMQQPLDKSDYRFNPNFWFPENESCKFIPNRPTASFVMDSKYRIAEASENTSAMFGFEDDKRIESVFQLFGSSLQTWFSMIDYLPKVKTQKSFWVRKLYRKADGSFGLYIVNHERLTPPTNDPNSVRVKCVVQDISDLFPEYVQTSYFI